VKQTNYQSKGTTTGIILDHFHPREMLQFVKFCGLQKYQNWCEGSSLYILF